MTDRFSEQLPTFKGEREEGAVDYERFAPWVRDGFSQSGRRESRPFLQMAAFLTMIICLGYGLSRPMDVKRALVGREHPRIALPILVSAAGNAPWSESSVRAVIERVREPAAGCLEGWDGLATNEDGAVVAEVVLTPEGPEEAALYDQTESVPQAVGDCLGNALGSVGWPLPTTEQAVTFPIVGGIQ